MWKLRESIPEAQRRHGASLKHDVSVPVSAIPALIERGSALVAAAWSRKATSSPTVTRATATCTSM